MELGSAPIHGVGGHGVTVGGAGLHGVNAGAAGTGWAELDGATRAELAQHPGMHEQFPMKVGFDSWPLISHARQVVALPLSLCRGKHCVIPAARLLVSCLQGSRSSLVGKEEDFY